MPIWSRPGGVMRPFGLAILAGLLAVACGSGPTPPTLAGFPPPYEHDFGIVLTTEQTRPRDANGIIMVKYPSGLEYNPVTVAQSALAHFDRWLRTKGGADRDEFLKDAAWLVSVQHSDGLWYYDFPNGRMPVPWVSAMAQGHACSVLVRAYAVTHDQRYRDAAQRSLATFRLPVGAGGVSMVDAGFTYYEEAMPPESPHILNGMVFAMYGALDMADILGDSGAQQVWDAGVRTLAANMAKYDSGSWSYYSQGTPPRLASRSYHQLHIQLLTELGQITGQGVFDEYASRFRSYLPNPPPGVP